MAKGTSIGEVEQAVLAVKVMQGRIAWLLHAIKLERARGDRDG